MPRPPIDDYRHAAKLALKVAEIMLAPYKANRDKSEPMRRDKMTTQTALASIIERVFRKQYRQILDRAQFVKAATPIVPGLLFDDEWSDDDEADLIAELIKAAKRGAMIFTQIDQTIVNSRAAEWARKYAGQLIKDLNKTTLDVLRKAVSMFVETPGFTLGDLASMLPFDASRALSIAVTETTRAYWEGNRIAGVEMAKEFPDIPVVKIWFTNNDDLVCPICGPLDGMEVELYDGFTTGEGEGLDGPPAHPNCRCWTEVTTKVT